MKSSTLPVGGAARAGQPGHARDYQDRRDSSNDKILGVHILAEGAGEVIQAGVYAIKFGFTVADLADTWHPYLTMAEGLKLAAQTFTRDVAKLSCCAA